MAIPWEKLKQEFITTDINQNELARKYKISKVTINTPQKAELARLVAAYNSIKKEETK